MKLICTGAFVCALTLAAAASASAQTLDDFNRADSDTLGANWTQQTGSSGISNNQAFGSELALATFNGDTGNTVSFDAFLDGSGTGYVAGVLAYADLGNSYFIKVQGDGVFTNYAFYYGDNGGGDFEGLNATFTSGHITASFTGTVATLTIDPTGGAQQVYVHDYGVSTGGNGVGLGFYDNGRADNFGSSGAAVAVPEPASWALMLIGFGGLGAVLRANRRRPAQLAA